MAGFDGEVVEIQIGRAGLRTDDPSKRIGPSYLTSALNCRYEQGFVEKERGSQIWNQTVLPAGVLAALDYIATDAIRRLLVTCSNGRTYKFPDAYSFSEVAATGGAATTLSVANGAFMVQAGHEESGNARKAIIFTGNNTPQVVVADATTRRDIQNPLPEWVGNRNPIDGIIHRNLLFVWNNIDHTLWASSALDHEDFLSDPLPYEVYSGEGERISGAFVFRGKLFAMKYPRGLYILNDEDADATNWFFSKLSDSFGGVASRSVLSILNDCFLRNNSGGITSLSSTQQFGDVLSGDMFAQMKVQNYVKENLSLNPDVPYHAVYYPAKKLAYFTYRSVTATSNDQICAIDFKEIEGLKIAWITKDQPTCMFLMRDDYGRELPYIGSDNGYIYGIDSENRWVGAADVVGTAYTFDIRTPYLDFGGDNPVISESLKQFERLEIVYLPMGDWNLNVDYFIDGKFVDTLHFKMCSDKDGSELDLPSMTFDNGSLDANCEQVRQLKMNGQGRRVSFRCYNATAGQNCKLVSLRVYFKVIDNAQKR